MPSISHRVEKLTGLSNQEFLERFAEKAPTVGWRGLLVGDMAQARGGPMITGHASHQVGLDAADGSGLLLSNLRYLTPKNDSIHERGLAPDMVHVLARDHGVGEHKVEPDAHIPAYQEARRPAPVRRQDRDHVGRHVGGHLEEHGPEAVIEGGSCAWYIGSFSRMASTT